MVIGMASRLVGGEYLTDFSHQLRSFTLTLKRKTTGPAHQDQHHKRTEDGQQQGSRSDDCASHEHH